MNKQQLQAQLDKIKQNIEQLEEQINCIKIKKIKKCARKIPKKGEIYYYLDVAGLICRDIWYGVEEDLFRFNIGNCFKTEEEVEEYEENLLTKQALKDLALELNNGIEIDWKDINKSKYFISYRDEASCIKELELCREFSLKHLGQIYCYDKNFLTIAKDRIGEEKLIKLIKSGV